MAATEDVYCTLVMSDSYLPGAAVLAHSLRDAGTKHKIAVLVTVDTLLYNSLNELRKLFDYVIPVDKIANPSLENLARLDRLDLRFAFTKIALWRQEQFRKIVYVDADVVALRAPDELFNIDAPLAAAPDIGWPDCFNSGVMMLRPNTGDYWSLQTLAASGTSFDGADQGLLNEYFQNRNWHRISFTYNCTPSSGYQYEPAYRHFRSSISMAHFIGKDKPWALGRQALGNSGSGVYKELLGRWWSVYDRHYRTSQSSALGGVRPNIDITQWVKDEQPQSAIAWATTGLAPAPQPTASVPPNTPEAPVISTEQPMTDPGEDAENIDSGIIASQVPAEPATFVPPQMDWDATRSEPPTQSKPEAASFPSHKYEMSEDKHLFKAPASYPEPPKNMWYEVPKIRPAPRDVPKPIFPWEQTAPKPTRVFADEFIQPTPEPAPTPVGTVPALEVDNVKQPDASADPWKSFTRTNAWDNVEQIESYVHAVKQSAAMRGRFGTSGHRPQLSSVDVASPTVGERRGRRESLVLTDFPSTDERPSLPVTPAPIRRPTFWGEDSDSTSGLPAAEGVPSQIDWNPLASIEQLRRASLIATDKLPQSPPKEIPLREAFPSSSDTPNGPAIVQPAPVRPGPLAGQGVTLLEPDFGPGPATVVSSKDNEDVDPKSVLARTVD